MGKLFFPTGHIHDGEVHEKADFDHTIYCQPTEDESLSTGGWQESCTHPSGFMKVGESKDIVLRDQHCYRRVLHGTLPNRDTYVDVNA